MPLIFSYGTLQQPVMQLETFGRLLQGRPDEVVGYARSSMPIEDPRRAAAMGATHYASAIFTGRRESRVAGAVFEVTDAELARADEFERLDGYKRVAAPLASGREAWMYVDARSYAASA